MEILGASQRWIRKGSPVSRTVPMCGPPIVVVESLPSAFRIVRSGVAPKNPTMPGGASASSAGTGATGSCADSFTFWPRFATSSAYIVRLAVPRWIASPKRSANRAWTISGTWFSDAPCGIFAAISNLGDPGSIIQSGPVTRSGENRKAYPINMVTVAHLTSIRPRSIFNDVGHPPRPLPARPPTPAAPGGLRTSGFTEATSNFRPAAGLAPWPKTVAQSRAPRPVLANAGIVLTVTPRMVPARRDSP
jgi:hypothetical protein